MSWSEKTNPRIWSNECFVGPRPPSSDKLAAKPLTPIAMETFDGRLGSWQGQDLFHQMMPRLISWARISVRKALIFWLGNHMIAFGVDNSR